MLQLLAVNVPEDIWMGTGARRGVKNAATVSTAYFSVAHGDDDSLVQLPASTPFIDTYRVVMLLGTTSGTVRALARLDEPHRTMKSAICIASDEGILDMLGPAEA